MTTKTYWNWQQHNWPKFEFDSTLMGTLEKDFLHNSGQLVGVFKHIDTVALNSLKIEFLSSEAVTTSEIEGEHLNRDSVQSSLRKKFGLSTDSRKVKPAEVSSKKKINAPGVDPASQDFTDAADPVKRFTESYFYTLMLRFGWLIYPQKHT